MDGRYRAVISRLRSWRGISTDLILLCCALLLVSVHILSAQELQIGDNVAANPPTGGVFTWYGIHIDPQDSRNMMICGTKTDSQDNAVYGFLYASGDRGRTWREALIDKSSKWVTEESCAFGMGGLAYFVADASKVDLGGGTHHDLGTTRIYVSHDSGKTWKLGVKTSWTDASSSVVDLEPGPNQNRLYVFFYDLYNFEHSPATQATVTFHTRRLGMISYRAGDRDVAGPVVSDDLPNPGYGGLYPSPTFILKDGSLLTVFSSQRKNVPTEGAREILLDSVRSNSGRTRLEEPVNLVPPRPDHGWKCGAFYTTAAAYDAIRNVIYFAYPQEDANECDLMIRASHDGGRSWLEPAKMYSTGDGSEASYAHPALAVNKHGVLGVMWEERLTGCWDFAVSMDGGKTLSRAERLMNCTGAHSDIDTQIGDGYLRSFLNPPDESGTASIALVSQKNSTGRNSPAIAASPDGVFHAVWTDAAGGKGQIRVAAVKVISGKLTFPRNVDGLKPAGDKVVLLYGGAQHFDPRLGTVSLEVRIRNLSKVPLRSPVRLQAVSLDSELGRASIINAANGASGPGAVWDMSQAVPGGRLAPGATSQAFQLRFHISQADSPHPAAVEQVGWGLISLRAKLYAGGDSVR